MSSDYEDKLESDYTFRAGSSSQLQLSRVARSGSSATEIPVMRGGKRKGMVFSKRREGVFYVYIRLRIQQPTSAVSFLRCCRALRRTAGNTQQPSDSHGV